MKEFIDKLIGRLEEARQECQKLQKTTADAYGYMKQKQGIDVAKEIVNELAEEYKGGWIPCSEKLPDTGVTVLAYGKRYDQHDNKISYYYIFTHINEKGWWFDDFGLCDEIIAWQPLPPAYEEADK